MMTGNLDPNFLVIPPPMPRLQRTKPAEASWWTSYAIAVRNDMMRPYLVGPLINAAHPPEH